MQGCLSHAFWLFCRLFSLQLKNVIGPLQLWTLHPYYLRSIASLPLPQLLVHVVAVGKEKSLLVSLHTRGHQGPNRIHD